MSDSYERIYATVRRVPRGKVATYGQIAALAGLPRHARQVGYALHALPPGSRVPWHRVVNAKGQISLRAELYAENVQRVLLEQERVVFNERGQISLERFQWRPQESGRFDLDLVKPRRTSRRSGRRRST